MTSAWRNAPTPTRTSRSAGGAGHAGLHVPGNRPPQRDLAGPHSETSTRWALCFTSLDRTGAVTGEAPAEVLLAVQHQRPAPPRQLAPAVGRVIWKPSCLKCLEKTPSARYSTAQALADDSAVFSKANPFSLARRVPPKGLTRWGAPLASVRSLAAGLVITIIALLTALTLLATIAPATLAHIPTLSGYGNWRYHGKLYVTSPHDGPTGGFRKHLMFIPPSRTPGALSPIFPSVGNAGAGTA